MDFSKAYAIMVNDLTEIFSSRSIYLPMIAVPVFFAIALPLFTFYVSVFNITGVISRIFSTTDIAAASAISGGQFFMTYFSTYVLGPIFLTMPIFTAAVIAADSFAGEKERKTSEALLSTPVTNSELLTGKIMSSFVPALVMTVGIFFIYGSVTNALAYKAFGNYILPTAPWIMMILSAPFLSLVAIGVVVLVSAHVAGIKEAQQISSLIVMPVLIIPFTSILGIADLTVSFFIEIIAGLIVVDAAVIYFGIRSFRKEAIL